VCTSERKIESIQKSKTERGAILGCESISGKAAGFSLEYIR
jgi:hypothetical protein